MDLLVGIQASVGEQREREIEIGGLAVSLPNRSMISGCTSIISSAVA